MDPDSAFQSYVDGGLAVFGIEADEVERAVMKGIWSVYQPALEQLLAADLSTVVPEPAPDLSLPPST